jgi:AraC-like DNA-binding protein
MSRSRQPAVRALSYDYPSGHRLPLHRHRKDQLVFAASGVMTVETPGGCWTVPPNRGVWVPARTTHAIRMSGVVAMRTLYVPPPLATALPRACRVLDVTPLVRELVLAAVARGGLDLQVPEDARLFEVLLDQLRTLPTRALHLPFPRDPRARRVADEMERRPGAARPARDVARGSGASQRTIERLFRAETGMSFEARDDRQTATVAGRLVVGAVARNDGEIRRHASAGEARSDSLRRDDQVRQGAAPPIDRRSCRASGTSSRV